ncbi:MAG: hypothetical protein ACXVAX_06760, partial [Pseudobdellovibrio sp.]
DRGNQRRRLVFVGQETREHCDVDHRAFGLAVLPGAARLQGYKLEKRYVYFEGGRVVGWETE